MEEGTLSRWSLSLAAALLFFYVGVVGINDVALLAGGTLLGWSVPAGLLLALATYSFVSLRRATAQHPSGAATAQAAAWRLRRWLLGLLVLALVLGLSAWLANSFFDLSWDGRDYQQRAIAALAQGWNPVYQERLPTNIYYNAELNAYPKAQWIAAAATYRLTGEIETGKAFNLLLMASVFFASFAFFTDFPQVRGWQGGLLSLALAANPVSLNQSLNYYVDGQVSSAFLLVLLLLLLSARHADALVLGALGCAVVLGLNLKFTGSAYVGLLCVAFVLVLWIRRRSLKPLKGLVVTLVASAVVGLFFFGFDPYVTNTLRYGHPLYPLYGNSPFNQQYLVGSQMPAAFQARADVDKLFLAITLPPQNDSAALHGTSALIPPLDEQTLAAYGSPDVRIAGWGPLFGLLLVIGAASWLALLITNWRLGLATLGLDLMVVFVSLPNSELWWARYTPQLWLLPLAVAAAYLFTRHPAGRAWGTMITMVALANLVLVAMPYVAINWEHTTTMRTTLEELGHTGQEVLIYYQPFEGTAIKLQQYGVNYRMVASPRALPCPQTLAPGVYYSPLPCPAPG